MSFDVPTLVTLIQRARNDLTPAVVSGALRRSDGEVLARVHGGAAGGLYSHQEYIADQIFPDTCDEEMLLRYATWRLGRGYREATFAKGTIECTGQTGAPVDAGTIYRTQDGREVSVTITTGISGTPTSVSVQAVTAGVLGNLAAGTALEAVSPVLGVSAAAVVSAAGVTGGVEKETIDALRAAVKRTYRYALQGGSLDDFESWALEVPDVTRAWARRNWVGPGTVAVFVMCDGLADPFPTAEKLAEVYAYIDARRHATGELYVKAPTKKPINFKIILEPDSAKVRVSVATALEAVIEAEASLGATTIRSHLDEAISGAEGEEDHEMPMPAGNVVALRHELAVMGEIEWLV